MYVRQLSILALIWLSALACAPAWAQRIRFPSPAESAGTAASTVAMQGAGSVYTPPVGTYSPPAATSTPPANLYAPPAATYTPPPATAPPPQAYVGPSSATAVPPVVPGYAPGQVPAYGPGLPPGPTATFQGGIQPPPATWDPYGTPGAQNPSLFPQDPYFPPAPGLQQIGGVPMLKFLQDMHLTDYWIPRNDINGLGLNNSQIAATFAFPFLYNEQAPLLVTPGFGYQAWDGPRVPGFDMPPNTYEAFLELGWNPRPTPWLGGELAIGAGVFSDFNRVDEQSVRFFGRGLMVLTFSPSFQIKGGVYYLDRVRVKLLPAGGIVWTPNSDVRFDILFPNPKLAWRWTAIGNTDWWSYVRGEYGGGSWSVERGTDVERVDYNDLRAAVGLEWLTLRGWGGFFEVGVAFERELLFTKSIPSEFNPDTMVFLGGGVHF